jgi:intraflagellar transport protein 80
MYAPSLNIAIYLFEVKSGRLLGEGPIKHLLDISEISLNKQNSGTGRLLALVDKNRDMYMSKVNKPTFHKLGSMIDTFAWNDENDLMISIMDSKLTIWYYPSAVFVDEDLVPLARSEKEGATYGSNAQITNFVGTLCSLRKADGTLVQVSGISPYAGILQEFSKKKQWEQAIRLCRHVKDKELWAALAAMSLFHQDLNTAEVAYAAIDEV